MRLLLLIPTLLLALTSTPLAMGDIWNGPPIVFTKQNFADWTLPENQDRITDNVWITRADLQGIFNIRTESGYSSFFSPADTEWGFGTTADIPSITFSDWQSWHGSNPPSMVGQDAVVHLISEDIFIDIRFLSWTQGMNGGGFSYMRSTIPEPGTGLICVGAMAGILFQTRRRRS